MIIFAVTQEEWTGVLASPIITNVYHSKIYIKAVDKLEQLAALNDDIDVSFWITEIEVEE